MRNNNILFAINHPAHYHLFKNCAQILKKKNYNILFTIKSKDVLENLLIEDNIEYINILKKANKRKVGSKFSILFSSGMDLLLKDYELYKIVKAFKPSIMLGCEPAMAQVGKLLNIPNFIFNEDDWISQPEYCYPTYPFTSGIFSPTVCNAGRWEKKKINYNGYHELSYLHPKYFKPDFKKVEHLFKNKDKYFLLRFVSLTASHDVNAKGISFENTLKIIEKLKIYGEIYITSERPLENELEKYRISINPSDIHHAIYYADLIIADSQTMTAEAAVLGTPSIRLSNWKGILSYLDDLEDNYQLTFGYKVDKIDEFMNKIDELIQMSESKKIFKERAEALCNEKIDLTELMVWFIENYPISLKMIKSNNNTLINFK